MDVGGSVRWIKKNMIIMIKCLPSLSLQSNKEDAVSPQSLSRRWRGGGCVNIHIASTGKASYSRLAREVNICEQCRFQFDLKRKDSFLRDCHKGEFSQTRWQREDKASGHMHSPVLTSNNLPCWYLQWVLNQGWRPRGAICWRLQNVWSSNVDLIWSMAGKHWRARKRRRVLQDVLEKSFLDIIAQNRLIQWGCMETVGLSGCSWWPDPDRLGD